jgi:hypothetical protein
MHNRCKNRAQTVGFDHNGICSSLNNNAFHSTVYSEAHVHTMNVPARVVELLWQRGEGPFQELDEGQGLEQIQRNVPVCGPAPRVCEKIHSSMNFCENSVLKAKRRCRRSKPDGKTKIRSDPVTTESRTSFLGNLSIEIFLGGEERKKIKNKQYKDPSIHTYCRTYMTREREREREREN